MLGLAYSLPNLNAIWKASYKPSHIELEPDDNPDASANAPEDAGAPQEKSGSKNPPMGTNEPVDPPADPDETPNPVSDTGGSLTPAQLVRPGAPFDCSERLSPR